MKTKILANISNKSIAGVPNVNILYEETSV